MKKKSSWCLNFLTSQGLLRNITGSEKKNCVNLTGLRDTQISGETFLGMSGRVFLEEISLWIGELSKEIALPIWVGIIQFLESLQRTERQGKANSLALLELRDISSPALDVSHHSSTMVLSGLSNSDLGLHHQPAPHSTPIPIDFGLRLNHSTLTFLVFQLVDAVPWDFSATASLWAKSYNKSLLVYIFTSYWFCFSGESLLIQIFQNSSSVASDPLFFLFNLNKMNLNVSVKNSVLVGYHLAKVSTNL